ncbi:zinc-ribbon domain-containing protein [Ruegeria sp. SCP11]|uniref:zinc-ribbon domain-containing protein n=1 Tax=Ruegeria sp. SCP11 TaxID=3141378 RepID=UPI0033387B55
MRLTCPNCGAQYEVPDEVIPEEGRDVQCSNCEKTWFQAKHPEPLPEEAVEPVAEEAPAPEPEAELEEPEAVEEAPAPAPEIAAEPAPEPETQAGSKSIDPAVANILKEEAAREADLRAKEGGSLEIQPDLALDAPPDPEPKRSVEYVPPSERPANIRQKGALPDVEAINSSLRSDNAKPEVEDLTPHRSGGGFLRGFALVLIVGVILLLIYGNAQKISEAVPQAEPILTPYVSLVDQARIWLETQTSGAAQN